MNSYKLSKSSIDSNTNNIYPIIVSDSGEADSLPNRKPSKRGSTQPEQELDGQQLWSRNLSLMGSKWGVERWRRGLHKSSKLMWQHLESCNSWRKRSKMITCYLNRYMIRWISWSWTRHMRKATERWRLPMLIN